MDDGAQRGRGADARVLVDQGARPALQRPPARRQELSVPRRHRRRAVPTGAGDARAQAQGDPLLRALRPRLRHPRDARRAVALVPDPHVQPGEVPAASAPRPAVPAVPHREVLRSVRRRDRRGRPPPARRGAVRVPRRRYGADRQAPRPGDARGGDGAGVREGGPRSATAWARCAARSSASRSSPTATRTSTSSASPTTSWRRRCRSSTSAGAGSSVATASSSTRSRTSRRAGSSTASSSSSTARTRPRACRSRCSCRSNRRTSSSTRSG